jgi:hypothetical protein
MSVSRINATSGTMAAAAAIAQAQAVQYANHFAELHNAIDSGDLGAARKALSEFQRDSAVATANGFDPVNQTSSLRREFSSIRKALLKGDIKTAQASLSTLKKELGVAQPAAKESALSASLGSLAAAVNSADLPSVRRSLGAFGRDAALATSKNAKSLGVGGDLIRDIRSLQTAVQSGDPKMTSSTFIKIQPALTSFTQGPQVFPTSSAFSSKLSVPSVNTSTQAVLQGLAATQPNAQARDLDGTSFAPTPEMMLGSKGMSIPAGAQLQFANNPVLLQTIAFRR